MKLMYIFCGHLVKYGSKDFYSSYLSGETKPTSISAY